MKVEYDDLANVAYIKLHENEIAESEEVEEGIIFDFDADNKVVGVEILGIKQRTPEQIKSINLQLDEKDKAKLRKLFNLVAPAFA
jgi:uncharacterized protein YuzE